MGRSWITIDDCGISPSKTTSMKVIIPKKPGFCFIKINGGGKPIVTNYRTDENKVYILCNDWEEAQEVCLKIDLQEHDGIIEVKECITGLSK